MRSVDGRRSMVGYRVVQRGEWVYAERRRWWGGWRQVGKPISRHMPNATADAMVECRLDLDRRINPPAPEKPDERVLWSGDRE